ncbi:TPA: hypothetical protein MEW19_001662 [Klebsiella pneumoniae]|nr:hypothetical protein [Klebsiella pneumoniae]HBX9870993.1 hypothetical protein [Klebsiella pneumoniae]
MRWFSADLDVFSRGSGKIRKPAEMGQIEKFIDLRRQIL